MTPASDPKRLVVVSAGTGNPSSTRQLTDHIAQTSLDVLREANMPAAVNVIELGPLALDIARATTAGFPGEELRAAITRLAAADAIIAATPVYKAGISGLPLPSSRSCSAAASSSRSPTTHGPATNTSSPATSTARSSTSTAAAPRSDHTRSHP